jgi:hypothetical protein
MKQFPQQQTGILQQELANVDLTVKHGYRKSCHYCDCTRVYLISFGSRASAGQWTEIVTSLWTRESLG